MKKLQQSLTILTFFGLCSNSFAQDFKKTGLPVGIYTQPKVFDLTNRQKVNNIYYKLSEVYTLDFSNAQTKSISSELGNNTAQLVSKAGYVDYSNQKAIDNLLSISPEALTVQIPFEGELMTIDMVQASLFGDGFSVQSNDPSKVVGIKMGIHYQGTIRGTNSIVGMSFFEDEFTMLISREADQDRTIESGLVRIPGNDNKTHIIYSDDDLVIDITHSCQSEDLPQYHEAVEQLSHEVIPQGSEKAIYKCVTYFWETSYNLYTSKGSTQAVTNYMTSLFNNFQIMYNNEQIGSKLNQLYIWTTQDSYNNNLNTFSANRTNFGANLATLFSTGGGGGVAWLDQLCGSNEYYKHGFCGSIGGTVASVPNYSWAVNVTTHEVGHNLGSPHTHACSWTGGAIDGCGPAAGYSEGCNGPIPSNGGTVMSYCHLNNVGMNLSLGFGSQPGNLIRSRVNSCITLTCDTGGGGQTCTNAYEPNETQSAAVTLTSGTGVSAAIAASGDVDYFKITTTSTANIVFNLAGPSGVDFDMIVYNSAGTQIGAGTGSTATESVTLNGLAAGTYSVKVFGYNNASSSTCYTLTATANSVSNCSTAYEPNNSSSAAIAIPLSTTISAAISSGTDQDFYKVTTSSVGTHNFSLSGPTGKDYDLYIYNSSNTQLGSGTGTTATENVSLTNLPVGTYTVKVIGYNGAYSSTCYTLNVAKTSAMVIGEEESNTTYSVYPNPTKDKLTIASSDFEEIMNVQVMDINGKVMSTEQITSGSTLDVNKLSSGIYFVLISSANKETTQIKFIKE